MSPLAQGLFHRAISQSGTALMKVFITYNPWKVAKVGVSPPARLSQGVQNIPEHHPSLPPFFSTEGCPLGWLQPRQLTDPRGLPEGPARG